MLSGNRKGSAFLNLIVFMIIAFIIGLFCVSMIFIANKTNEELEDKSSKFQEVMSEDHNASEMIADTFGNVPGSYQTLKWVTTILIFGYILSMVVTNFLIRTHPVFFIPYIFIVIISVIIAVPISNAYETISTTSTLASSFTGFWGQNWIFAHLPLWIAVIGFFSGIILFVNWMESREVRY